MEFLVRKRTRLGKYDYSSSGFYFLTICTKDKKKLLGKIVGDGAHDVPEVVLSDIGKVVQRYILSSNRIKGVTIDKYVIMPNHIHLLVFVDDITDKNKELTAENAVIPHVVSTFKRLCSREIGENIFQRSYYDHIVRNEKDYQRIWTYIETNPQKWNLDCYYVE